MGMAGGLHGKASTGKGKPYGLMVLVAFGAAALLAVVLLHKFRETRVCNLLLQRTDRELQSSQQLLQRERDRSKELAKNNEDMRALLYLLRTQKMELDRRLLELQSTIYSLREKQKIVNVKLHEKLNEIKVLREKEIEIRNENSQLVGLRQSLKQKEGELKDLRRRLESRGAVDTDGVSDPREDNKGESKSTEFGEGSASKSDESEAQKAEGAPERREIEAEEKQMQDRGEKTKDWGEKTKENGFESKLANDHRKKEGEESEAGEHQRADKILQSRGKPETETGKYGRTRKTRGKRWRYIANNRAMDNGWRLISKKVKQENNRNLDDRVISVRHRKFVKEDNPEEEARKNPTEKESKTLKQEELNSKNIDRSSEDVNGEVDGDNKQNLGEEMEITNSKSEERQEQEREEDGHFNRESNSEVVDDAEEEEEDKEEMEESEF